MKICQLLELIRSIPTLTINLIRENTSAKMMDVHGIIIMAQCTSIACNLSSGLQGGFIHQHLG